MDGEDWSSISDADSSAGPAPRLLDPSALTLLELDDSEEPWALYAVEDEDGDFEETEPEAHQTFVPW